MKAKIVVADDEPRIRAMIALLLKEDGYEVQTAANGQEAVDALLSFRPDVILLDQQMPVLTGVEALEKIAMPEPSRRVHNRLRFRLLGGRCRKERRLRFY